MCPTTKPGRTGQRSSCAWSVPEYNADGVYIDRSAPPPPACFDTSHGHPLGGGSWWLTEGTADARRYPRSCLPTAMITTECNAETCRWMDGIRLALPGAGPDPLFAPSTVGTQTSPAPIGRTTGGMNAAQSLSSASSSGGSAPTPSRRHGGPRTLLPPSLPLALRTGAVHGGGEMARPPVLGGGSRVTADWAWRDKWEITDDAPPAWRLALPRRQRARLCQRTDRPRRCARSMARSTTSRMRN